MTVISSKEFATNQAKYYNLARNGQLGIKRGKNMYHLTYAPIEAYPEQPVFQPDDDFYRSISIDELRKRVKEDIHQWYKERNDSNSITGSTTVS